MLVVVLCVALVGGVATSGYFAVRRRTASRGYEELQAMNVRVRLCAVCLMGAGSPHAVMPVPRGRLDACLYSVVVVVVVVGVFLLLCKLRVYHGRNFTDTRAWHVQRKIAPFDPVGERVDAPGYAGRLWFPPTPLDAGPLPVPPPRWRSSSNTSP